MSYVYELARLLEADVAYLRQLPQDERVFFTPLVKSAISIVDSFSEEQALFVVCMVNFGVPEVCCKAADSVSNFRATGWVLGLFADTELLSKVQWRVVTEMASVMASQLIGEMADRWGAAKEFSAA